jgi:hypothetical protein
MLSTDFAQFAALWLALALGLALGAVIFARKCSNYCSRAVDWMAENTAEAVTNSKTGDLERSLTELWDSHSSLLASHKRLRSKYGMRDLRERRSEAQDASNGQLDLYTTQDKQALRDELRRTGRLR